MLKVMPVISSPVAGIETPVAATPGVSAPHGIWTKVHSALSANVLLGPVHSPSTPVAMHVPPPAGSTVSGGVVSSMLRMNSMLPVGDTPFAMNCTPAYAVALRHGIQNAMAPPQLVAITFDIASA